MNRVVFHLAFDLFEFENAVVISVPAVKVFFDKLA